MLAVMPELSAKSLEELVMLNSLIRSGVVDDSFEDGLLDEDLLDEEQNFSLSEEGGFLDELDDEAAGSKQCMQIGDEYIGTPDLFALDDEDFEEIEI